MDLSASDHKAKDEEERVSSMALYKLTRVHDTISSISHLPHWTNADTASFDSMHYEGDVALEHCASRLDLRPLKPGAVEHSEQPRPPQQILDIGSGFGATGRYLAKHYDVVVTGIELQKDIHDLAQLITTKNVDTRVRDRVQSINGDFLGLEPGRHGFEGKEGSFDHIVSFLCITHIPKSSRPQVWRQAARYLKPGTGQMYIEDFFLKGELTEAERRDLDRAMACPYLPTLDDWVESVEAFGFQDVEFEEMSDHWRDLLVQRAQEYREREEKDRDLESFYDTVAKLFVGGHVGGLKLYAVNA